ncbi:endoplasmic reticulum vesicle transporter-domain-containing protein [Rhodocollybia butyracea]|uniref:Endoplasmic reticulum vesicle transporter-domain-containing protein n=1 Tax=Rhodocollybia butyracea TaxID=206335 RepID=A0A9P5UAZ5_9AGAR|nr:endoplasmic reticulum vesicle transporter-domain-containing protein [Rhodocollybia butyracea]
MATEEETSLMEKLDSVVPAPLAQFDAFPKIPSTYKSRSESRGFMTVFVCLLAFLLMLNDIGEFIWGWPDYEFNVDKDTSSFMNINVDLVVNMPCRYISVDLRDAIGDRLFLSGSGLRRDGRTLSHAFCDSGHSAISEIRGLFDTLLRRTSRAEIAPTYSHPPHPSACRVYGTIEVKKVTANLHITTLGHGYASREHVNHNLMNLSHVITEFSFGPFFPEIAQPLDYSFELATDPFIAYQYFLHVVPTTYIAPRSDPLHTHQYSVTHYTRVMEHNQGTPGIFFKFDLDPMSLTIHQRTTTFTQLLIRCVGVIGGVFVCMSYAIRITSHAVKVVTGGEDEVIAVASSSGAKAGLRSKWGGGELRSRGKMIRQGSGWTMESNPGSPALGGGYGSYANTPLSQTFSPAASPYLSSPSFSSPSFSSPVIPSSNPGSPNPSASFSPPSSRPSSLYHPRTPGGSLSSIAFSNAAAMSSPSIPGTPAFSNFPPTPNPATGNGAGFPTGPPPRRVPSDGAGAKKDD